MKAILICPSPRAEVLLLTDSAPLATIPLLGHSLLEYWLSHLAGSGFKDALILAQDRPEQVRALVGNGERWGLKLEVLTQARELTPEEASRAYGQDQEPAIPAENISVLDHFPGAPERPLFTSYAAWFAALQAWLPRAQTPDRVGARQIAAGIWVGSRSHISSQAELRAPCWVGQNVIVGADAVVGPRSIVEDGTFIEPGAEIVASWVTHDTFVGQYADLKSSFACGDTLINWKSGCFIRIPDPFLLCSLRAPQRRRPSNWLSRLAEFYSRDRQEVLAVGEQLVMQKES
jgi:NDP-sugar pyrophosphorylase family protein